ncbi:MULTISPECIES: DNA alkylation repair protein [unclassified Arthrobacter]|uniref:DNA alkylation repair protein n=1 Tax=unclassified Arthrobacter TaxID=235627 RepID=UPI0027D77504|nr:MULTISPECIES: DNA alkylation repair protein [unclassified Arthrobacter]
MSDAGGLIDASLQREGSWLRAEDLQSRWGSGLQYYGASVGAVRGTVRDALRRHRDLTHDEITALSSELWSVPVFERRLSAVVLLQSRVRMLDNADLTRIEGFLRTARMRELSDPLAIDVVGPLVSALDLPGRVRADSVLDRWAREPDAWLRRSALLSPLRALRAGGGDWPAFVRHAKLALAHPSKQDDETALVREAVAVVLDDVAKHRPELEFTADAT